MSESTPPSDGPRFSVLIENESGVMEVFLRTVPVEQGVMFRSVGSVALSGRLKPTDPDRVIEAVKLMQWSSENVAVFEGRVTSPAESNHDEHSL